MPAFSKMRSAISRLPGSGLVVTIASALSAIAARIASCWDGTSPLWNEVLTVWPVDFHRPHALVQEYQGRPGAVAAGVFHPDCAQLAVATWPAPAAADSHCW